MSLKRTGSTCTARLAAGLSALLATSCALATRADHMAPTDLGRSSHHLGSVRVIVRSGWPVGDHMMAVDVEPEVLQEAIETGLRAQGLLTPTDSQPEFELEIWPNDHHVAGMTVGTTYDPTRLVRASGAAITKAIGIPEGCVVIRLVHFNPPSMTDRALFSCRWRLSRRATGEVLHHFATQGRGKAKILNAYQRSRNASEGAVQEMIALGLEQLALELSVDRASRAPDGEAFEVLLERWNEHAQLELHAVDGNHGFEPRHEDEASIFQLGPGPHVVAVRVWLPDDPSESAFVLDPSVVVGRRLELREPGVSPGAAWYSRMLEILAQAETAGRTILIRTSLDSNASHPFWPGGGLVYYDVNATPLHAIQLIELKHLVVWSADGMDVSITADAGGQLTWTHVPRTGP